MERPPKSVQRTGLVLIALVTVASATEASAADSPSTAPITVTTGLTIGRGSEWQAILSFT
jgi:hypothetical protein